MFFENEDTSEVANIFRSEALQSHHQSSPRISTFRANSDQKFEVMVDPQQLSVKFNKTTKY